MTITKTHELKALRSRMEKAKAEHSERVQAVKDAQREEQRARSLVEDLQRKIDAYGNTKPVISEHALLRYIERVMGFDLDAIREMIMTDSVSSTIRALPNGKIPIDGGRLVVQNGVVVTIEA